MCGGGRGCVLWWWLWGMCGCISEGVYVVLQVVGCVMLEVRVCGRRCGVVVVMCHA